MHPVVSPTFLKRCTTFRGMKTMVPGPGEALAVHGQIIGTLDDEEYFFLVEMERGRPGLHRF